MKRRFLGAATAGSVAVVLALGACSDNSSSGPSTSTAPGSSTSSGSASPPASAQTSLPASGEASSEPIPMYPGATVVNRSTGYTLLRSNDSVSTVGSFYVDTLAKEGWQTISKYQGRWSVNVTAKRGHEGVTVQVNPSGSGTDISIATYPV